QPDEVDPHIYKLKFLPPVLDFGSQLVGVPRVLEVMVINEEVDSIVDLESISSSTIHFHYSFFLDKVDAACTKVEPEIVMGRSTDRELEGGKNTSFKVVFMAQEEGPVKSHLHIHTSFGTYKYHVMGRGVGSLEHVKKISFNYSFPPVTNMYIGDFQLELDDEEGELDLGLQDGSIFEVPIFENSPVKRAMFLVTEENQSITFVRVKINGSHMEGSEQMLADVEVLTEPGMYSAAQVLHLGLVRSDDSPKVLSIGIINSAQKPITIQNVFVTPVAEGIKVDFEPVRFPPDPNRAHQVANITFDPKRIGKDDGVQEGKIVLKAKNNQLKVVLPYQMEVLHGELGVNASLLQFHTRGGDNDLTPRKISVRNGFRVPIMVIDATLATDLLCLFSKQYKIGEAVIQMAMMKHRSHEENYAVIGRIAPYKSCWAENRIMLSDILRKQSLDGVRAKILEPGGESEMFELSLIDKKADIQLQSHISLWTNASEFRIPIVCYNGRIRVLLPSIRQSVGLDFGTKGLNELWDLLFAVQNENPVPIRIRGWGSNMTRSFVELLGTDSGDVTPYFGKKDLSRLPRSVMQDPIRPSYVKPTVFRWFSSFREAAEKDEESSFLYQPHSSRPRSTQTPELVETVRELLIIAPGYFVLFRLGVRTPTEEGMHYGKVFVHTVYEEMDVPFRLRTALGTLSFIPTSLDFPDAFPGKISRTEVHVYSSFHHPLRLARVSPIPADPRLSFHAASPLGDNGNPPPIVLYPESVTHIGTLVLDLVWKNWRPSCILKIQTAQDDLQLLKDLNDIYSMQKRNCSCNVSLQLDTNEVKGFQFWAKVELKRPRLGPLSISLPLTQVGNVSVATAKISNPSHHPVLVQAATLPFYPPSVELRDLRAARSIRRDQSNRFGETVDMEEGSFSLVEAERGDECCNQSQLFSLEPNGSASLNIIFFPSKPGRHLSLLFLRNNLTGLDLILLEGEGSKGELKFGNRRTNHPSPFLFDISDRHLKDCHSELTQMIFLLAIELVGMGSHVLAGKKPSPHTYQEFTLKRSFSFRNTGDIPVHIHGWRIGGYPCEGYGFRVVQCSGFHLSPNESRSIEIVFSPDFTLSRVQQTLTILSSLDPNGEAGRHRYQLLATVAPGMLLECAATIPRPPWETLLYYTMAAALGFFFSCTLVAGYLEADGILRNTFVNVATIAPTPSVESSRKMVQVFDLKAIAKERIPRLEPESSARESKAGSNKNWTAGRECRRRIRRLGNDDMHGIDLAIPTSIEKEFLVAAPPLPPLLPPDEEGSEASREEEAKKTEDKSDKSKELERTKTGGRSRKKKKKKDCESLSTLTTESSAMEDDSDSSRKRERIIREQLEEEALKRRKEEKRRTVGELSLKGGHRLCRAGKQKARRRDDEESWDTPSPAKSPSPSPRSSPRPSFDFPGTEERVRPALLVPSVNGIPTHLMNLEHGESVGRGVDRRRKTRTCELAPGAPRPPRSGPGPTSWDAPCLLPPEMENLEESAAQTEGFVRSVSQPISLLPSPLVVAFERGKAKGAKDVDGKRGDLGAIGGERKTASPTSTTVMSPDAWIESISTQYADSFFSSSPPLFPRVRFFPVFLFAFL
ncbi:unnamed protein product, partial [Darwinula stevensoni]